MRIPAGRGHRTTYTRTTYTRTVRGQRPQPFLVSALRLVMLPKGCPHPFLPRALNSATGNSPSAEAS